MPVASRNGQNPENGIRGVGPVRPARSGNAVASFSAVQLDDDTPDSRGVHLMPNNVFQATSGLLGE